MCECRNGTIPKEQTELPKKPFLIMGALDSVAGIMQIFAVSGEKLKNTVLLPV